MSAILSSGMGMTKSIKHACLAMIKLSKETISQAGIKLSRSRKAAHLLVVVVAVSPARCWECQSQTKWTKMSEDLICQVLRMSVQDKMN